MENAAITTVTVELNLESPWPHDARACRASLRQTHLVWLHSLDTFVSTYYMIPVCLFDSNKKGIAAFHNDYIILILNLR